MTRRPSNAPTTTPDAQTIRDNVLRNTEASRRAKESSNFGGTPHALGSRSTTKADWKAQEHQRWLGDPRYGGRKISDDLYDELTDQTPTQEIRDMVNEGVTLPMPDPVLPGLTITKRLHVVSPFAENA